MPDILTFDFSNTDIDETDFRLDPKYYNPKYSRMIEDVRKRIGVQKLPEVATILSNNVSPEKEPDTLFHYIDIDSIDIVSGFIGEPKQFLGENAPDRAKQQINGQNLLYSSVRPTRGAVALTDEKMNGWLASTGFFIIEKTEIDLELLWAILKSDFVKEQARRLERGGMYPAIISRDFRELCLPRKINRNIAEEIIEKFRKAKNLKRVFDYQLLKLRQTVEEIVGVYTLEQKDCVFEFNASDTRGGIGGRIDPKYFQPKLRLTFDNLKSQGIEIVDLLSRAKRIYNGHWIPESEHFDEPADGLVLRIQRNYFTDCGIDLSGAIYISEDEVNENEIVQVGDLLLSRSGSCGRAAVVTDEIAGASASEDVTGITLIEEKLLSEYVELFLNSTAGQFQVRRILVGSVQEHLNRSFWDEILIPVLPMPIQEQVKERYYELQNLRRKFISARKQAIELINRFLFEGNK